MDFFQSNNAPNVFSSGRKGLRGSTVSVGVTSTALNDPMTLRRKAKSKDAVLASSS